MLYILISLSYKIVNILLSEKQISLDVPIRKTKKIFVLHYFDIKNNSINCLIFLNAAVCSLIYLFSAAKRSDNWKHGQRINHQFPLFFQIEYILVISGSAIGTTQWQHYPDFRSVHFSKTASIIAML